MNEKKDQEEKRKPVCLILSEKRYKELNQALAEKYGNVHGHIGKAIDEGIMLWIEKQKNEFGLILPGVSISE